MKRKTIQYTIDPETGQVWSRVGNEIAIPVLDYEAMKLQSRFEIKYRLERMGLDAILNIRLIWTRKVDVDIKNIHRKFWGMKPLSKKA